VTGRAPARYSSESSFFNGLRRKKLKKNLLRLSSPVGLWTKGVKQPAASLLRLLKAQVDCSASQKYVAHFSDFGKSSSAAILAPSRRLDAELQETAGD
jgi:hypothetical protein